jgi:hypothetical protein
LIEAAFAERPYPGDDRIADSDPRYEDYEGHAVARFHRGKSWQEVTRASLEQQYPGDATACLAFMTPEGWQYYLPAYLLIALEGDGGDSIGDALIGNLTYPRARVEAYSETARALGLEPETVLAAQTLRFEERLSGLDPSEIHAVRAALEYIADRIDAADARHGATLPNDARTALSSWP